MYLIGLVEDQLPSWETIASKVKTHGDFFQLYAAIPKILRLIDTGTVMKNHVFLGNRGIPGSLLLSQLLFLLLIKAKIENESSN